MSIVQGIIRGFIGEWGVKVGDWYLANSLWINGALLLYALIISISWKNYLKISDFLLKDITEQLSPNIKNWSKNEITRGLKGLDLPLDDARKKIFIPIIAKSGSYLPRMVSKELLRSLFTRDFLVETLREINKK